MLVLKLICFFKYFLITTHKRTTSKMTTIQSLREENIELRELLEEQAGKLERAIFAIYQLHGGLYNQTTQNNALTNSNALLFGETINLSETGQEENYWFTTRQGDKHELRFKQLEEIIKELEGKVHFLEKSVAKKH